MNNKCPKCNERLSPFYMKQTCPKCNTNLVYYDLDKRLEADHEKAMREQAAVDRVLNNIKTSAFGGAVQIIRFVTMFTPLLWMCIPMYFDSTSTTTELTKISLIWFIKEIISGALSVDAILTNKLYLFSALTIICIVLFSLAEILSSLFSLGEKAYKRNKIFHIVNCIVCLAVSCLPIVSGGKPTFGLTIVFITYVLTGILHKAVDKKLNQPTNE